MIGLERGTVELVSHRAEWEALASEEIDRLVELLESEIVEIHHVGSTAIEGLAAKPVIDLLAVVESIERKSVFTSRLGDSGYEYRGHDTDAERLFFAKGLPECRTFYLSVTEQGSRCHREQLAFRNQLEENPELVEEYESLKRELADAYPDDRASYTDGKHDFVERVLRRALDDR